MEKLLMQTPYLVHRTSLILSSTITRRCHMSSHSPAPLLCVFPPAVTAALCIPTRRRPSFLSRCPETARRRLSVTMA
ncbi:unnamed protein product [Cuscuta campestris]|uniref:Uncharacterized protein n=1 Tax=Cuscuta campestris TaxID=132261 RepID=A0A484NHR9_9ASTE|nr:unnamed protein product [Cuscuta campestris]